MTLLTAFEEDLSIMQNLFTFPSTSVASETSSSASIIITGSSSEEESCCQIINSSSSSTLAECVREHEELFGTSHHSHHHHLHHNCHCTINFVEEMEHGQLISAGVTEEEQFPFGAPDPLFGNSSN
jgi:hypothetical protein